MFQKHRLYLSTLIIMDYSLFPSWSTWHLDMEYMVFGYYLDMASILWHCIMLHCIALHWHMELCREPMVPTVPVQHRLLGTTMQLHTLGMKAGVHMHPCAYIIGLA